jgi:hypothetical protein
MKVRGQQWRPHIHKLPQSKRDLEIRAAIRTAHEPFEGVLSDAAVDTHVTAWPGGQACPVCLTGVSLPWGPEAWDTIARAAFN